MINKKFIRTLGFLPKENAGGIYQKIYSNHSNYIIEIDINREIINYGKSIKSESKATQTFFHSENFVVLNASIGCWKKGISRKTLFWKKHIPPDMELRDDWIFWSSKMMARLI